MAEQLAVEVDVKNVMEQYTAGQAHLFCLGSLHICKNIIDEVFHK